MADSWVRLVIAISLDGRLATSEGGKAMIGKTGDRKVLEDALSWSDATLMGGGTLRAHKNTCLIHSEKLIKQRQAEGRSDQPTCFIVSSNSSFSCNWEFFRQPIKRYLLHPQAQKKSLIQKGFDEVLEMKSTWSKTLLNLKERGYPKIVLLGGAKLINSLLLEDQINELQITFTPRLLGGQKTWVEPLVNNIPYSLTQPNAWSLKEIKKLGENELMTRYFRNYS